MTRNTCEQCMVEIPTIAEEGISLPQYASEGAAGADVRAFLKQEIVIEPGTSALIPTGLRVAIPKGYEIQIRPRSGLALNDLITVLNTPGTIDSDYRGEVKVILINHGKKPFVVTSGMRIAQFVIAPVIQAVFCLAESVAQTERGDGGFGSSGRH